MLHWVYDQPEAESVAAQYDRVLAALREKLPRLAEHHGDGFTHHVPGLDARHVEALLFGRNSSFSDMSRNCFDPGVAD